MLHETNETSPSEMYTPAPCSTSDASSEQVKWSQSGNIERGEDLHTARRRARRRARTGAARRTRTAQLRNGDAGGRETGPSGAKTYLLPAEKRGGERSRARRGARAQLSFGTATRAGGRRGRAGRRLTDCQAKSEEESEDGRGAAHAHSSASERRRGR